MRNIIIFCGFLATLSLVYVSNSIASSVGGGGGSLPTCSTQGYVLSYSTATGMYACASVASSSGGDVVGPASATDNGVTIFDGTTGELLKSSSGLTFASPTLLSGVSGASGATGAPAMHARTNAATVADWQYLAEGNALGYGAGMAMASKTSAGGTVVNMAKIVADGDSAWNTTGSTQDARVSIWSAVNGTLTEWLRLVSSGSHKIFGTNLGLDNGAAGTFVINNNAADGAVKVAGGNGGGNGGEFVGFGQTHASSANDFALRASDTNILYWDNSANTIEVGKAGTNFRLTNGAAGTGLIALSNNDGLLHITPHTSSGSGPNFRMFGGNHATLAQDIELSTNADNIFYYDHSANTIGLGRASSATTVTGTLAVTGTATVASSAVATAASTTTFTNKTIDADGTGNSITNIENADIKSGAAIAYSKLNLGTSIVNADINGSAAIALSKISQTGMVEEINFHIETAADKTYTLIQKAGYARQIVNIAAKCASGTISGELKIDGTGITSCQAAQLAWTSSETSDTCDTGSSNNLGADTTLTLVTTSNSACLDLVGTITTTKD